MKILLSDGSGLTARQVAGRLARFGGGDLRAALAVQGRLSLILGQGEAGGGLAGDMTAAGMLAQKGLPGARSRRRRLADAGLAQVRARLRYKQAWYGCRLVEADRFYPSSQICSACGLQTAIGWAEEWDCPGCAARHHRDDNAAVNLARYPDSGWQAVGPVGSRVKRRAGGKTGPGPARGVEAPNPNPERGAA